MRDDALSVAERWTPADTQHVGRSVIEPEAPSTRGDQAATEVLKDLIDGTSAIGGTISVGALDGTITAIAIGTPGRGASDQQIACIVRAAMKLAAPERALPFWSEYHGASGPLNVLTLLIAHDTDERFSVVSLFYEPTNDRRELTTYYLKARLPLILPFFRMWHLAQKRARHLGALESVCDGAGFGILMISQSSRVIFANVAATALLDRGQGLRRHRDGIQATEVADSVRLQVALNHVIAANTGQTATAPRPRRAPLFQVRRSGTKPLIVAIVPAEQPARDGLDVAAILYVIDPLADTQAALTLACRTFNLSPVETRLAILLAGGRSVVEAASMLRIKDQTARSYIKQIFIKTDTRRQVELVHLLLSSAVRMGDNIQLEPL